MGSGERPLVLYKRLRDQIAAHVVQRRTHARRSDIKTEDEFFGQVVLRRAGPLLKWICGPAA